MSRYVGFRLMCPVYDQLVRYAGIQGKSPSQWIREAVEFKLRADVDGVGLIGDYWAVPSDKAALLVELPLEEE